MEMSKVRVFQILKAQGLGCCEPRVFFGMYFVGIFGFIHFFYANFICVLINLLRVNLSAFLEIPVNQF